MTLRKLQLFAAPTLAVSLLGSGLAAPLVSHAHANVGGHGGGAQTEPTEAPSVLHQRIMKTFHRETEKVGKHTISYEVREGSRHPSRTFVLAHGATATAVAMHVVAADLARAYPSSRILIVDLPWHGESVGPAKELTKANVHTYTDVMKNFLKEKRADHTITGKTQWIGWSMGASMGLLLSLDKANDIDELTLLNGSPVWNSLEAFKQAVPALFDTATVKPVFEQVYAGDLAVATTEQTKDDILAHYDELTSSPEVMVQDFKGVLPDQYNIEDQISKIKAKTLILGGSQDPLATTDKLQEMDQKIKKSKLVIYDDNHSMLLKPEGAAKIVGAISSYYKH